MRLANALCRLIEVSSPLTGTEGDGVDGRRLAGAINLV
jgi:hypothetical protein